MSRGPQDHLQRSQVPQAQQAAQVQQAPQAQQAPPVQAPRETWVQRVQQAFEASQEQRVEREPLDQPDQRLKNSAPWTRC